MKDVEFSPTEEPGSSAGDATPRLYELRQYKDGPARVPFTVDRFGSGEVELFQNAGMETLKFWRATDDSAFIYLLGHSDRDASKNRGANSWAHSDLSWTSTKPAGKLRLRMHREEMESKSAF